MRIEGVIKPAGSGSEFTKETWCLLIDRRPELRRGEPRQGINPFNGERMLIPPRPDAAEVVVEGITVGAVR